MQQYYWNANEVVLNAGEAPAGHVWVTGYDGMALAVRACRVWGGRVGEWVVARIVPRSDGWRITHIPTGLGVGNTGRAGPTLSRLLATRADLEARLEAQQKTE